MVGAPPRKYLFVLILASTLRLASLTASAQGTTGTIISSNIRPVRYVLVNSNDEILEIQSNSQVKVEPTVFRSSYSSRPTSMTPEIMAEYNSIITKIDLGRTGVVYKSSVSQKSGPKIKNVLTILADTLHKTYK